MDHEAGDLCDDPVALGRHLDLRHHMIPLVSQASCTYKPFEAAELTGPLIKAARALLRMRAEELAADAMLGLATIKRAERATGRIPLTASNADRILHALIARGLEFLPENGGGVGVRLAKPN